MASPDGSNGETPMAPPTAQCIARTYSHRSYTDMWEVVEDYRQVVAYKADHPNAGRTKIGNRFDLPPGRVRGWINDKRPDAVRGIDTAIDHGWLEPEPTSDILAALVKLAAHVLAGGSISATWVPSVTVGGRVDVDEIQEAFDEVGVETSINRADESSRATEVVPRTDGSVLGRCLYCLGVPQGTTKAGIEGLPNVLAEVPDSVREAFVWIVIRHRGVTYEEKATSRVMAERPREYLDELAALIEDVTGESITADDRGVTIPAAVMRELDFE